MKQQLKPCPFCGCNVEMPAGIPSIHCKKCEVRVLFTRHDDHEAVSLWNTRHNAKPESKSRGSIEEITDFCAKSGLPESDAEYFFNKCEGNGWLNGKHPIKDWRATIRSWKAAGYMPSQKQPAVSTSPKGQIPAWKQIQAIKSQLETHPANPEWIGYVREKVTPEQREHYQNQKANLKRLEAMV